MHKKVLIPIILAVLLILLGVSVVTIRIVEKYSNQSASMSNIVHSSFIVIQQKLPDGWNISEQSPDKVILKKSDASVIVQNTSIITYNAFKDVDSFNKTVVPFFKKKNYETTSIRPGTITILKNGKEMPVSSITYTLTEANTKTVNYHFDSVLIVNNEHTGASITIPTQDQFVDAQQALLAIQIVD